MSEGDAGPVVLVSIAVASAAIWHWVVKRYFLASIGAAFSASIVFQIAAYLHIGYLDPFYLIALVTGAGVAFVVALLVGPLVNFLKVQLGERNAP